MKRTIILGLSLVAILCFCSSLVAQQCCCASKCGVGTNAQFKGPVGIQQYSLRDLLTEDVNKGLEAMKEMGFKYLELGGPLTNLVSNDELKVLVAKYGFETPAILLDYGIVVDTPEKAIAMAKEFGAKYVGVPYFPHAAPFSEEDCRSAIETFNRIGKIFAEEGLKFYYHNHGYEFYPYKDGETLFDLLIQETDPETVFFEMDILWTIFPGQDPVSLIRKYPGRFPLYHLKDLKKGIVGDLSGGTPPENDVPLGTGQADYPAILQAAQESGVEYFFIEDESPTVLEGVPQSLGYLESISW